MSIDKAIDSYSADISEETEIYLDGYRDGYWEGVEDALAELQSSYERRNIIPLQPFNPMDDKLPKMKSIKCAECKVDFGNGAIGYVCNRRNCPTFIRASF